MNAPSKTRNYSLLTVPDETQTYAQVVFNLPIRDAFTYIIPERFQPLVCVGMRVFVPFGRRKITGYVVSITDRCDPAITLKAIEDVPDTEPVVLPEILSLTRWMADYYHASWGEAIKAALPAGLDDESRETFLITADGQQALDSGDLTEPEFLILDTLSKKKKLTAQQIARSLKKRFSAATLARLKQSGWLAKDTHIRRSTVHCKYEKVIRLKETAPDTEAILQLLKRSPKQMAIYNFLTQGEKTISELSKEFPAPSQAIKKLQEREIVEVATEKFQRPASVEAVEGPQEKSFRFTKDQEKAFKKLSHSIDRSEFSTYLLHGVTGSGKTEIYLRCIQRALEQGKTAIMMVPEISLTPQTVTRFQNRFGNQVAILHSGLSQTERYQEWEKIRRGKVSIVVGARSAVFAPFKNPGVVVIDEEHDTSYKQDASPRYHARDTAIVRARAQNAVVILGSATPSMESLHNAKIDKYQYLSLGKRVQDRLLPVIRLVDMNQERKERKNYSILSGELRTAIRNRLERKEQTFLFLNRRGTAHYVNCRECAFVFDCPRCSVTLTFHGRENVLRCHYCGHQTRMSNTCKDCGGEVIRFSGFGTQKLEEETRRLFPEARIIRLDRDTTRGKSSFETMHRLMNSREIDILIGTQMITKGHDFPHVTLVGVVQADLSLNIPDFRASERSFQLLTQVAGRAGRGGVPGQVIIQTSHPDHYVFDFVKKHDIEMFYQKEINFRKKLNYPPFTRMVAIEIEAENERQGESTTRHVKTILARLVSASPGSEILGPSRAALYQIKNKFRWHIILRSQRAAFLQTIVSQFLKAQESNGLSSEKIKISLDVDPVNIM